MGQLFFGRPRAIGHSSNPRSEAGQVTISCLRFLVGIRAWAYEARQAHLCQSG
jgi:hypothetical protein